ncbi:MAG: molybdopterin converting factor small subunit [Gammaproteobacteria bacterium]
MITVNTEYHSHFKEITGLAGDTFELDEPLVSELATKITEKYGAKMKALLIDPRTNDLNANGTMYVDSKGKRIFIDDTLEDGETIAFLVGIAGG